MAARAYWKGHIRLSLVSIGVELYSATKSASRLTLHQIHEPSGKRVRYQKIAPGVGPIDSDDIVRGYEVSKDNYVVIEPDELDAIKLDSKETIDLVQFVDACEIDPRYFYKPYYIIPAEGDVASEGFAVLREALKQASKVGLGQMAVRGRDHVVAIRPCGSGLLLETLRYPDEIRESDSIFDDVPEVEPDEDMLELAGELIERKAKPFDPEAFSSAYTQALLDLIEEKRKKGSVQETPGDEGGKESGNVVDLMEALRKSVAKDKKSKTTAANAKSTRKSTKPSKRAGG
jgi:DNA end-binding protein Ku